MSEGGREEGREGGGKEGREGGREGRREGRERDRERESYEREHACSRFVSGHAVPHVVCKRTHARGPAYSRIIPFNPL